MQKQIAVVLVIILFIVIGLCGCNGINPLSSEESRFVGTWKYSNISDLHMGASTYTFFSDGTCSVPIIITMSGIWEIKDNKLVIEIPSESLIFVFNYYFSNSYQNLTLVSMNSNDEIVLIKQ